MYLETVFTPPARTSRIVIEPGCLDKIGAEILSCFGISRCVLISDHHVMPIYAERVMASLDAAGHKMLGKIEIPAGEASKSFAVLQQVLAQLMAFGVDRKTRVIALGGGVVGDLAGFAAAIFMRGVEIIQIPTSLLAQIDSSVGGKTAIDLADGKNVIGAFHPSALVMIDSVVLTTLSERQFLAGIAECLKYGFIGDADFITWCIAHRRQLLARDSDILNIAISHAVQAKMRIVESDPMETTGQRALLNLGHTFGHAWETLAGMNDTLLHGEAVSIGIVQAFEFSAIMGVCTHDIAAQVKTILAGFGLPVVPPGLGARAEDVFRLMQRDKKAIGGEIHLILGHDIGKAYLEKAVDAEKLLQYLEQLSTG